MNKLLVVAVSVFLAMGTLAIGLVACADGGPTALTSLTTAPPGATSAAAETTSPVARAVAADGVVTLGVLSSDGFALALPADAYPGVADVTATRAPAAGAPPMENATSLGDGYSVDTGGVGRLDDAGTLTYVYDPAKTADPMLLALAYFDGQAWTYIPAASADAAAQTVTFPLFHFSAYYPSQFKSELEAAKYYSAQMAAQKVLGEKGGDSKVASRALTDLLADKLGLGGDEFSKKMFADIAADQDFIKIFDEHQTEGWTDTGYAYVMDYMCGKVATRLSEAKKGDLSAPEAGLGHMWDLLKVGKAGSKFLGFVSGGDMNAAGKELFDLATDYTGIPGKAIKYTLQGMQNALDVWRDGEVEKAFQVYTQGSSGTLFGYGAVDAGNFDEVWDNMKGAARQLSIERIKTENEARATVGLLPLTAKEEDFYREKVKTELKSEFERRITLNDKIEQQKKNLDLILSEPYFAQLLEKDNVSLRSKNTLNETLESRLTRFNHFIGRIFSDLQIDSVYQGPQQEGELDGRISSTAMAEMLHGYFVADTQAEAEKFLKEYYKQFGTPLEEFAGTYAGWVLMGEPFGDAPWEFTVDADGNVTGGFDYQWPAAAAAGGWGKSSLAFTGKVTEDGSLSGSGVLANSAESYGQSVGGSGTVTISGKISGDAFTGNMGDRPTQVTATRQ